MKKTLYILVFATFFLVLWLSKYFAAGDKVGSEIQIIESSIFSEVTLIRNPGVEDVFLYLVFPSGEASNNFDEGLAHYVEHLAWLSAFGGDQNERMRHSNAWTNRFSTGYWQKTVSNDLHRALRTLISISGPLNVEEKFSLEERDIILREYDYRVAERPLYSVFRDMDRTLYGDGALARSLIGEPDVIAEYTLDAAASLHKQSHALSDATLLVYGNVSKARLEAAIASLLVEDVDVPPVSHAPLVESGVVQNRVDLSLAGLSADTFLYRKLVPLSSCDTAVRCEILTEVAENALRSSLPGGLAGPLRYDQFVTRSFSFNIAVIGKEYVEISFIGHPDADVPLEKLEHAFHAALRITLENGLSQQTFDRIASRLTGRFSSILERDQPGYDRDLVLDQLTSAKPVFSLVEQKKTVNDIKLEDVNQFLKTLKREGREVTRLVSSER